MNKKLIALAVAGACVAPAAMAQTANPVTLYGQVNVMLESVEAKGGATPVARRTRIEDQSSRLGVRGTEDLGGGLKAFFQLETAFRPDSNNTTFAARNSAIGLQGGFGSVLIGRWDMPFKSAAIAIDPYGDIMISGITGVLSDRGNFDRRDQNVLQYWSPTWGGLAFRVAATANENKSATSNPRDMGANVTYSAGRVYAFLVWEQHKDNNTGNALQPGTAGTPSYKEDGFAGGGAVTFGPIKVGAQYQEFKKTGRTKQKAVMLNGTWTIGSNQIIGQYMEAKDGHANGAAAFKCDSWSAAYKYNFSRRTSFVASYVKVTNNDAANCNFGSNALAIAAGQDPQGAYMGFLHNF